jgi:hypothetical protein
MFKCPERRAYFEHNIQPLVFASQLELDAKSLKCFVPSCNELRVDARPSKNGWCGPNLCPECLEDGFTVWFCTNDSCHKEGAENRSHQSLVSKYLSVSDFLRLNERLCSEMGIFTEGELAEVVCICAEENWSSGDLMGDNFFPMQNRHKLKLHFENKYRLNLDDFIDGSQQFIFCLKVASEFLFLRPAR